jgi:hypothetical protein
MFDLPCGAGCVCVQLLSGAGRGALLEVFAADTAVHIAQQPKLPKKGARNILVSGNLPAATPHSCRWSCARG